MAKRMTVSYQGVKNMDSDLDLVERCRERNRIAIRDHLEAQCLLEIQTVQLAARRRTLDDVRRLRTCLAKRGEYSINDELDDFVDRDQALHAAIAEASHNVALQSMYRSFSYSFHSQYLAIFADNELHEPGLDAHASVVEAVIYGDEARAAQAVQAMFKPMLDKLSLLFERDKEAIIRRAER
jgi:DNA-binding FadR family transcriptional regulator